MLRPTLRVCAKPPKKINTAVRRKKTKTKAKTVTTTTTTTHATPAVPPPPSTPVQTPSPTATANASNDDLRLDDYVVKSMDGSQPAPEYAPRKYVNKRREDRWNEYKAMQPRLEGAWSQDWIAYGMRDSAAPHPTFDVSTEEIQEYISGTEYAELPEVKGKNEDWPRVPHETDAIEANTTGLESDFKIEEKFDEKRDLFGSAGPSWITESAYKGHGHYDIDLTKPGAEEAFKEDLSSLAEEREYQMAHAHVASSTNYQTTRQMRWVDGKWVASVEHGLKAQPHPAFSAAVGVDLMEADVDVGDSGDGGYSKELERFAALSQSNAGVEDDSAEELYTNPNLLHDTEGDPLPLQRTPTLEATSSTSLYASSSHAVEEAAIETFEPVALESGVTTDASNWKAHNFMSLKEEVKANRAEGSELGLIHGVPVDALDTTNVVSPNDVHEEHEHHVFSGLYPRREDQEMTEFEKERLARCLEQHQKKGVPLAFPGVNPYATNAFVRRSKTFTNMKDDETGRKHDLAVEFRLRQQMKLNYSPAEEHRPRYRITDEGGRRHEYTGSTYWKLKKASTLISHEPHRGETEKTAFIKDEKWKMYGDTPMTMTLQHLKANKIMQTQRRAGVDMGLEYLAPKDYIAYKNGRELEAETRYHLMIDRMREEKERAYKERMEARDTEDTKEEEERPLAPEQDVAIMRTAEPDAQEVEYEQMKLDDIEAHQYDEPGYIKPNEDMVSTYGRNPWITQTRYSAWRDFGLHFKDIDEEYLQLRGTGYHDYKTLGPLNYENLKRRHRISEYDDMRWNMRPHHKEKVFKHFRSILSSNNHLNTKNIDVKKIVHNVGPSRYTINDLLARDEERPAWAFGSRVVNVQPKPTDTPVADVFDWNNQAETPPTDPPLHKVHAPDSATLSRQARTYTTRAGASMGVLRKVHTATLRAARKGQRRSHVSLRHPIPEPTIPDDKILQLRAQFPKDVPVGYPTHGTTGVVMTVDGVLQRGGVVIPGVTDAIKLLHTNDIPTLFVSSGYPEWTEAAFADNLSQALKSTVTKDEVVLGARSLLSHIGGNLKDKPTLVIGPKGSVAQMRKDGFVKAVGVDGISESFPHHVPRRWKGQPGQAKTATKYVIDNIIIVGEPEDWQTSLQICIDVLTSDRETGEVASLRGLNDSDQGCSVYVTDERLVFSGAHTVPRLAAGSFVDSLKAIYASVNVNRALRVTNYGRLNPSAQTYIQTRLADLSKNMGHTAPMEYIYSLTDNLHHDAAAVGSFRDANHDKWWSILLGSGVTNDGNKVTGVRTRMEMVENQPADSRSFPDEERLRTYLNDRRADVAYESLPLFVSDLLKVDYHNLVNAGSA